MDAREVCERRRVAGRLEVGRGEFACNLVGGCECRRVAGCLGVMSNFGDGFLWGCGGMCGMICVSYKIWPFIWFLLASMSEVFWNWNLRKGQDCLGKLKNRLKH